MQAKPLVLSDIRKAASAFVARWRTAEGYEKGEGQKFVAELLKVYGISGTTAASYEKRANKASGGKGFIDALVSGLAIIEMKSRGKDLFRAEQQAIDYMDSLTEPEKPKYIITSNFDRIRVLDLTADPGTDGTAEFVLDDLPLNVEALAFLAGYTKREFGSRQQAAASVKAAQLMASLYEELEKTGYDDHQSSVFLVRTLFCLFADDAGLWERDLFLEYIDTRTSDDGSDLGAQLAVLYQTLNKPLGQRFRVEDDLLARFPYVNGSVFGETIEIPAFTRSMRAKLIECCLFNWGQISPAIFGSLFQAVKSKKERRALGEHYTTETNILKLIEPLFLDEFRARYIANQHDKKELQRLQSDMGKVRYLDPACGCGNFLVVAYREMRALELAILKRLQEIDPARGQMVLDATDLLQVKMTSFYGIEIEEWPATIARTAMFLVDHQANQEMALTLGLAPDMLPLIDSSTIFAGNALRADWNRILPASSDVMVFGNPPFLGHATRTPEQAAELRDVWGREDIGRLDYVTGWYAKVLSYFRDEPGRWAFVSTNSIAQGEPVRALFGQIFAKGWRIRFAHRTFRWTSEAAGAASVHCVIVGFDRVIKARASRYEPSPRLFLYDDLRGAPKEEPAKTINGYLVNADHVTIDQRREPLSPVLPAVVFGNMPRDNGKLLVEPSDYDQITSDPFAAKYVRRFVGTKQLIHNLPRWCLWLTDMDPADVARSPELKKRLEAVRDFRRRSRAASTAAMSTTPHLFGQRSQPAVNYLCIPRHVSEDRPFFTAAYFPPDVIVGDSAFQASDPDGFVFGVISSSMFITWQRTIGGTLESRLRFSNTIVWNNLPLPNVSPVTRARIVAAGAEILKARARHPDRSLAEHYNSLAMDPSLVKAHSRLDTIVDKAFGARKTCVSEEERQEVLFKRYAELAGRNSLPLATSKRRKR